MSLWCSYLLFRFVVQPLCLQPILKRLPGDAFSAGIYFINASQFVADSGPCKSPGQQTGAFFIPSSLLTSPRNFAAQTFAGPRRPVGGNGLRFIKKSPAAWPGFRFHSSLRVARYATYSPSAWMKRTVRRRPFAEKSAHQSPPVMGWPGSLPSGQFSGMGAL